MLNIDANHTFFEMARRGQRLTNAYAAVGMLLVILLIVFSVSSVIGETAFAHRGDGEAYYDSVYFLVVPFSLVVLGLWAWVAAYERRPFWTIGFPARRWFQKYVLGLLIGFVMMVATVLLMWAGGGIEPDDSAAHGGGTSTLPGALIFLLGFIVQGGAEEVVIRGWLMQTTGARHRPLVGIIVATVAFTAMHGSLKPMVVLNILLFAIFLTFYCLKEGSIWGICGWHASWNWTQRNFFGLELTGHSYSGDTLLDLKASGSPLLGGGGFGPEASVMCTLVLAIGVVSVLYRFRKIPAKPNSFELNKIG